MPRTRAVVRRTSALACLAALAACSGAAGIDLAESDYEDGAGITATVLPQLAAAGEATEASTDAEYVVDATIKGAKAGRVVELQVADGKDWTLEDSAETDADGRVALSVAEADDFRVVSDGDTPVGIHLSTDDAPVATFTDEFDERVPDAWGTRDQGYAGVRLCSRASDEVRPSAQAR